MDFEFDKEMDSLLRQAARSGEAVSAAGRGGHAHVEADEISLFAENALPVKARARVTEHLADCNRCRKILSGLISLNTETESEIIHPKTVEVLAPSIPWYKKLFVFPQVAFAMGALAVVLSGVIVFTVLQNSRESQNASVAQNDEIQRVQERPRGPSGASSDGETVSGETYSMSNSSAASTTANTATSSSAEAPGAARPAATAPEMSSNMSVNSAVAKTMPPPPSSAVATAPEPNAPVIMRDEKQLAATGDVAESDLKATTSKEKSAALSKREDMATGAQRPPAAAAAAPAKKAKDYAVDGLESRSPNQSSELSQNQVVQNQQMITPDSRSVRQLPLNGRNVPRQRAETTTSAADAVVNERSKASETRTAGGKVFKRADNAWYDSAFGGQRMTTVRRNSSEYKKLDAGLRSIAENIGGVVVVVWKGRAYRIQ